MATATQDRPIGFGTERKTFTELVAANSSEALVGAAAVVLSIIGLAGIEAVYMVSIATIAIGAALVLQGALAVANRLEMSTAFGGRADAEGMNAEIVGGASTIVLGVLALIGVSTMTLVSVA